MRPRSAQECARAHSMLFVMKICGADIMEQSLFMQKGLQKKSYKKDFSNMKKERIQCRI